MMCQNARLGGCTFDLYDTLEDASMSEASDLLLDVSALEGVGLAIVRFVGIEVLLVKTLVFGLMQRRWRLIAQVP